MFVSEYRYCLVDLGNGGVDEFGDVISSDSCTSIVAHAIMNPLPKLNPGDLCSRRVLHKMVKRDAPIATEPSACICKNSRDIRTHALGSDFTRHFRVQQVTSSDADVFAPDVILRGGKFNIAYMHRPRHIPDWGPTYAYRKFRGQSC